MFVCLSIYLLTTNIYRNGGVKVKHGSVTFLRFGVLSNTILQTSVSAIVFHMTILIPILDTAVEHVVLPKFKVLIVVLV